jgi:hypothetical protein
VTVGACAGRFGNAAVSMLDFRRGYTGRNTLCNRKPVNGIVFHLRSDTFLLGFTFRIPNEAANGCYLTYFQRSRSLG